MNQATGTASLRAAFANAAHTAPATPADAFERALEAYTNERYREAFEGLADLADRGHVGAAHIALLMVVHGAHLFGGGFDIPSQRRARWLDATAAAPRRAIP